MRNTGMTHIEIVFIYKECSAWNLWCQSLVFFNLCFIGLCLTRGHEAEYWICRCLEEAGTGIWELLISSFMKSWWLSMACRQLVLNLTWSRSSVTQSCVVWCPALCVSACHKEVFARSEWHSDLCNSMWHSVQILEIHHHLHWVLHANSCGIDLEDSSIDQLPTSPQCGFCTCVWTLDRFYL
jgi:hypothetical protein